MSKIFVDDIVNNTDQTKTIIDGGNIIQQNKTTESGTLTIANGSNAILAGPVTIQDLNVNGHLNVVQSLDVTANLVITSSGSINIVG